MDTNADGFWPLITTHTSDHLEVDLAPLPDGRGLELHVYRARRDELTAAWLDDDGRLLGFVVAGLA